MPACPHATHSPGAACNGGHHALPCSGATASAGTMELGRLPRPLPHVLPRHDCSARTPLTAQQAGIPSLLRLGHGSGAAPTAAAGPSPRIRHRWACHAHCGERAGAWLPPGLEWRWRLRRSACRLGPALRSHPRPPLSCWGRPAASPGSGRRPPPAPRPPLCLGSAPVPTHKRVDTLAGSPCVCRREGWNRGGPLRPPASRRDHLPCRGKEQRARRANWGLLGHKGCGRRSRPPAAQLPPAALRRDAPCCSPARCPCRLAGGVAV